MAHQTTDDRRAIVAANNGGTVTAKRICPSCGGRKDFYAKACRPCSPKQRGNLGKTGPDSPAWKGGKRIDRDGYIRTYDTKHPWPRKGGYVLEHVRVMELHIGRRVANHECVHHIDHDRTNNRLDNLELMTRSAHSALHRSEDWHLRTRTTLGQFAGKEVCP